MKDYAEMQVALHEFKRQNSAKRWKIEQLEHLRNVVAHGANLVSTNEQFTEQTVQKRFEMARKLVEDLLPIPLI